MKTLLLALILILVPEQWYAIIVVSNFNEVGPDGKTVTVVHRAGELFSTTTVVSDTLRPELRVKELSHEPDFCKEQWNVKKEELELKPIDCKGNSQN